MATATRVIAVTAPDVCQRAPSCATPPRRGFLPPTISTTQPPGHTVNNH